MTKISGLTTKTTPVGADLVTGLDSEDTNTQTKNKNFLLSAIATFVFGSKTTTDLSEGTNKYVTDTNLDATTTITDIKSDITDLGSDKEDVSNKSTDGTFATPNNTDYPTTQAVKTLTDNLGVPINSQTAETEVENDDEVIFYDESSGINKKITIDNVNRSLQYTQYLGFIESDVLKASADTERTNPLGVFSKVKEIRLPYVYRKGGTIRIKFDYKSSDGNGNIKLGVNSNGFEPASNTISNAGTIYATYTSDELVVAEDYITLWVEDTGTVRNLRIYYNEVAYTKDPIINLD